MKNPITQNLIAPCGMNCGICKAYLRQRNSCHGCHGAQENKPTTRVNCRMRVCEKRSGKFCCHCPEFPCEKLRNFDKRYRTKYGMSEIENLEYIRDNGIREFVAAERKKWISETGVFCVHDKKHYK
jgi:hypothetical protein